MFRNGLNDSMGLRKENYTFEGCTYRVYWNEDKRGVQQRDGGISRVPRILIAIKNWSEETPRCGHC